MSAPLESCADCPRCQGAIREQEIADGLRCQQCAGRFEFNNQSPDHPELCLPCASVRPPTIKPGEQP